MPSQAHYKIAEQAVTFEETIKKSRFITELIPVNNADQARGKIKAIKQQHPAARHHCSAFVAGPPNDVNQLGFSDDGEPSGTAGKPMLAVLQGSGVGHILAVVIRYSGGIKLGTGGLVKAYGGGVKQALALLPTKIFVASRSYQLTCPYPHWPQVEFWLKTLDVEIEQVEYGEQVYLQLALSVANFDNLQAKLQDIRLALVAKK